MHNEHHFITIDADNIPYPMTPPTEHEGTPEGQKSGFGGLCTSSLRLAVLMVVMIGTIS